MKSAVQIKLSLNGKDVSCEAHPFARLLDVIREELGHTGTKEGCGEGECGACAVLLDGKVVNSCLVPVTQAIGKTVTTVEGLSAKDGTLSTLQSAFVENNGAQCGICTPGMLIAAYDLLSKNKNPSLDDMREALAGNLCRCTGYMKIFDAIKDAAKKLEAAR